MNYFSERLGQRDWTLLYCNWIQKQTIAGSLRLCFLIQWSDFIKVSISVFPGSIWLKDLVWDSSTLWSLPFHMVGIVLPICSYKDISCTVQGYLLNFAREIRFQLPEVSNTPCLKCVMFWRGCSGYSLCSTVIFSWKGAQGWDSYREGGILPRGIHCLFRIRAGVLHS